MSYVRNKILEKENVNIKFPENIKKEHKNLFQKELK